MGTQNNCQDLQKQVSQLLLRHKSILDNITKFQESNARVNRAVIKSVTNCGCLQVDADKQVIPESATIEDFHKHLSTHLKGDLCDNCHEVLTNEIGNHLFYMAALANTLNINLNDVIDNESDKISTLGFFNLT
ncbi:hypothetical protein [Natranaerobius thermophilus]|uniref:DUF1573 domain-containing protein n=1 Tax=Natranaerobius thermophilus (strain ATCC BAA-1301 / DSM 18059 / JW/NM-WN-LF) TaxID=457570 RepID=B2A4A6_NATTJ|nr:hypothetical protein [Natranaerobius thermophilus]ACB83760.1 conserved hypothetical protein [Natranaerobius thermophilus JW/NM-WN-LF]